MDESVCVSIAAKDKDKKPQLKPNTRYSTTSKQTKTATSKKAKQNKICNGQCCPLNHFPQYQNVLWGLCISDHTLTFKILLIEWHCCCREVKWKCWRAKSRYNETLISPVPSQGLLQLSLKSRENLLLIIVKLDQSCITRWRLCESSFSSALFNRDVKKHNFILKDY